MSWKRLTIDQYADFERANGAQLKHIDGIWWRKVRLFFYRPLYFNTKLVPGSVSSPAIPLIGGYQHLVGDPIQANSRMNFLLCENDSSYSVHSLSRNYRKNIARALRNLVVKPITDRDEFIHSAYPVYLSFYGRTRYEYLKSRLKLEGFAKWSTIIFSFPEILILGAFHQNNLEGISISYQIEESVIYATFFCSDEGLKYRASELMLHSLRELAAQSKDVRFIFMGMSGGKANLDLFKTSRGGVVASEPSYLKMNPLLKNLLKHFWKSAHSKLLGIDNNASSLSPKDEEASHDLASEPSCKLDVL